MQRLPTEAGAIQTEKDAVRVHCPSLSRLHAASRPDKRVRGTAVTSTTLDPNVRALWDAAYVLGVAQSEAAASRPRASSYCCGAVVSGSTIGTPADVYATGEVNGYPCGGSLPSCCTLQKESGGNPTAQNPTSSSSGLWQFTDDTWGGYGGYQHAKDAPASVQNERAVQVFAGGAGASNWYGDGCYGGR